MCRFLAPLLCVALVLGPVWAPAAAEPELRDPPAAGGEQEIDRLSLAALLLRDGHVDRAAAVLARVDADKAGLDLARYHMLCGLAALKSGRQRDAAVALKRSLAAGQRDPMVQVFLAQARFGLRDWEATLAALDAAGEAAAKLAGSFLIRAQCQWRLGRKVAAWTSLFEGLRRYPGVYQMARHKVLLLVDMGLYQQARQEGARLLGADEASCDDHVAVAEALRRGEQLDAAIEVLERARLHYPDEPSIAIQLAHTYLEQGRVLTAAMIFDRLSRRRPRFVLEAAELFRRAGKLHRALVANQRVPDQKTKIRQRLGLLIDLERFEQAAALKPRLARLELLADDGIAYALAYALYRTGRFAAAEAELKRIVDADLFDKANQLRRAMAACRQRGWACE